MRKLAIVLLLMSSSAFAASIDANQLASTLSSTQVASNAETGSFNYGGQDISQANNVVNSQPSVNAAPIFAG